jgi:hypothetical protein
MQQLLWSVPWEGRTAETDHVEVCVRAWLRVEQLHAIVQLLLHHVICPCCVSSTLWCLGHTCLKDLEEVSLLVGC